MKKFLLSLVALMAIGVSAWADGVTVPLTRISPTLKSTLRVTLSSTEAYRDLQFDLTLPEGISLEGTTGGIVTDKATGHTIAYNTQESGAIRFLVVDNIIESTDQTATSADASAYGKSLSEGIIVEIPVRASETYSGTNSATLANMSTSKENGEMVALAEGAFDIKAVLLGDVDDNGKVESADVVNILYYSWGSTPTTFYTDVANVNNDENDVIDQSDAIQTLYITFANSGAGVKAQRTEIVEETKSEVDEMDPE